MVLIVVYFGSQTFVNDLLLRGLLAPFGGWGLLVV